MDCQHVRCVSEVHGRKILAGQPVDFDRPACYFIQVTPLLYELQDLVRVGQLLAERNHVAGSDGNMSSRSGPEQVLITPAGRELGDLAETDLLRLDLEGNVLEGHGRPSSETAMHLAIYARRPEVSAVVHAHPVFATAFAAAGEEIPWDVLPETALFVGPIPLTDYAAPGTDEVPQVIDRFLADNHALLLRNHGVVTLGRSLKEAYRRLDMVEHTAQILFYSRQLGHPQRIPEYDLERLIRLRREMENQNYG